MGVHYVSRISEVWMNERMRSNKRKERCTGKVGMRFKKEKGERGKTG